MPNKQRKRRHLGNSANGCDRRRAQHKHHVWCWGFVFDRTASGSALKWLSIVDEYTRECLVLKVARGITSEDVIDTLAELFAMRGMPRHIRSDNGPEFIAQAIRRWLGQVGVEALYIEPGSPWENGYAESFHSLGAARALTVAWREDYNDHRPHSSLGYQTPAAFAAACAASAFGYASASAPAAHANPRESNVTPTRTFITAGTENQCWSPQLRNRRETDVSRCPSMRN